MRQYTAKLICFVLMLIITMSAVVPLGVSAEQTYQSYLQSGQPFVMYKDGDYYRIIGPAGEKRADVSEKISVNRTKPDIAQTQAAATSYEAFPKSVDLSTSKHFPPVGNQAGLGSCASFSAVYYQLSYEVNKKLDVKATYENTRSPQIVYNFVNAGSNDGTEYASNYRFLQKFGAPTMSVVPYSDADYMDWHTDKGIWREGIRARLKDYTVYDSVGVDGKQITSPDDPDLFDIKTQLNNDKIVGYSTFVSSWIYSDLKTSPDAPANNGFSGEKCVIACDGTYGAHAMAIVGYNDEIWIDVNNNNKVDAGEMGAFKVVNSYSADYCNDGFVWVAYDALNKVSCVEGYTGARMAIFESLRTINVRDYNELSDIYIEYTLNTAKRTQHEVVFTAEKNGTVYSWEMFYGAGGGYKNAINEAAFDGTANACDGTFVCPLDNIVSDITYEDFESYTWTVEFRDTKADSNPLVVKDVRIVNELTGKSYPVTTNLPCSVDGSHETFTIKETTVGHKVIYYTGYDNPTLCYKVGDSELVKVSMEENFERIGSTHKYVIEDANDNVTLYFTDENGNIDDNDGKLYTASERLNYYRTANVRDKVRIADVNCEGGIPDVGVRFFFEPTIEGGYAPFNDQYTIENLDTGEIKYIYYNHPSEKSFVFYNKGNYRISVEVTDQAGDIATFTKDIYIEDLPFEFDFLEADSTVHFVGDASAFTAKTKNEKIIARGPQQSKYTFDVKDSSGKLVYTHTTSDRKYSLNQKWSRIPFEYTPAKAGYYTLTVSSTDDSKQYAEMTLEFSVFDKIYGDANSNGSVSISDATHIQKRLASIITDESINLELADSNCNCELEIMDATLIQKYLASYENTGFVGNVIEYIPPTEPETEAPTSPPTQAQKNTVTFTNSLKWSGALYCYYWSDSNNAMTSWPGVSMTSIGVNDYGESMYTFDVPTDAQYIIFTNSSAQTTDIPYPGGEIRYYPLVTTDSKGHNNVATW